MKLAPLYKKGKTGKIQFWSIHTSGNTFITETGQLDGKKIVSAPTICIPKNVGKVNSTNPEQQAFLEAQAKWESQKKKGYVESVDKALSGEVDSSFVAGGYEPMLAEKFRDHSAKLPYPCAGQPKLDGHRATFKDGHLYSRTRKRITSCPHIEKILIDSGLAKFGHGLDGELYNHDYKDDFESLSSAIRKKDPLPPELQNVVQYHLYDLIMPGSFNHRYNTLVQMYDHHIRGTDFENLIKLVPTFAVATPTHAEQFEEYWRLKKGFEGFMLRNPDAEYFHGRTVNLQKVKVFQDAEFKIVGADEGKGKFKNAVSNFICEISDDKGVRTFKAGLKNVTIELQREWWEKSSLWLGKTATIEFLNYTRKNHVPRTKTRQMAKI